MGLLRVWNRREGEMFIVIDLFGEPFVAIDEEAGAALFFDTREKAEDYGKELQKCMVVELP